MNAWVAAYDAKQAHLRGKLKVDTLERRWSYSQQYIRIGDEHPLKISVVQQSGRAGQLCLGMRRSGNGVDFLPVTAKAGLGVLWGEHAGSAIPEAKAAVLRHTMNVGQSSEARKLPRHNTSPSIAINSVLDQR